MKTSLPLRLIRNRHDNAVWFWEQARVRRAIELAFAAPTVLATDREIAIGGTWPVADDPRPLVLAACDERYFERFAVHLARSSAARSPATRFHLHLYDPSAGAIAAGDRVAGQFGDLVTVSREGPARNPFGEPKSFYFAAGRFGVAARLRRDLSAPIMMVDADGLIANDLVAGFGALREIDAGFILTPGNAARYRRVLASAIYLGPGGEDFFTRLADGIGLALRQRGQYHVDQLGIHYALQWQARHRSALKIGALDLEWSDFRFSPDSLIWSAKGARKGRYEALLKAAEETAQSASSPLHPR